MLAKSWDNQDNEQDVDPLVQAILKLATPPDTGTVWDIYKILEGTKAAYCY
jgi:hypothetical protein